MNKQEFIELINEINLVSSLEELEKVVTKESILDKITLNEVEEDKATLLLSVIGHVGLRFNDSFELACPSFYGGTNIFGLSMQNKRPKVYMGYKWKEYGTNHHGGGAENVKDFRYIVETNHDNEIVSRYSYDPEYFEEPFGIGTIERNIEMYENPAHSLHETLTKVYQKGQEAKVLSKKL